jgi:hypothetical protein
MSSYLVPLTVSRTGNASRLSKTGAFQEVGSNVPVFSYLPNGNAKGLYTRLLLVNQWRNSEDDLGVGTFSNVTFGLNDWGLGLNGKVTFGDNSVQRTWYDVASLSTGAKAAAFLVKIAGGPPLIDGTTTQDDTEADFGFIMGSNAERLIPSFIEEIAPNVYFVAGTRSTSASGTTYGFKKTTAHTARTFEVSRVMLITGTAADNVPMVEDYTYTSAGTATRNADVIKITSAASIIGQTSGTIFAKINYIRKGKTGTIITVSDAGTSARLQIGYTSVANALQLICGKTGGQINTTMTGVLSDGVNDIRLDYTATTLLLTVNGVVRYSTSSGFTIPDKLDQINIGSSFNDASQSMNFLLDWAVRK